MNQNNAFLDILPTGQIRFNRDILPENREIILDIITDIIENPEEVEEIKRFLDKADDVDLILGDRILCG